MLSSASFAKQRGPKKKMTHSTIYTHAHKLQISMQIVLQMGQNYILKRIRLVTTPHNICWLQRISHQMVQCNMSERGAFW